LTLNQVGNKYLGIILIIKIKSEFGLRKKNPKIPKKFSDNTYKSESGPENKINNKK